MENIEFCCSKCKGTNVQIKVWENMNTGKYESETDDDDVWCPDCEEHVTVKEKTIKK